MTRMLFFRFEEDENIVEINYHELIEFFLQYLVHERLKECRDIDQFERHYSILEMLISTSKGRLSLVLIDDSKIVIDISQIQLRIDSRFADDIE